MQRAPKIPLRFLSRSPFRRLPFPPIPPQPSRTPISGPSSSSSTSSTHFSASALRSLRRYSSGDGFDQNKEVDMINLKFGEAREEIELAMESKDTVYFNEEADCARAAVNEVLNMFDSLSAKLSDSERAALQRSMGLKMEQLKAELRQLDE